MSSYNNSLLYFKRYYDKINWLAASDREIKANKSEFDRKNKQIFSASLPDGNLFTYPGDFIRIDLQTTYPGLLLGSGIAHGSGLLGEMKIGIFLDHTTGLPLIPGSSVKGVLRSAFPQGYRKAAEKKKYTGEEKDILREKAAQTVVYLKYYLQEISGAQWTETAIESLEVFLFGKYEPGRSDTPMSGRVVFHDALPIDAPGQVVNRKTLRLYLSDDYITPHKNRKKERNKIPDALVNPTPISFLKVLPGVTFRFQFVLQDFTAGDGIHSLTKADISKLFCCILKDFGLGAKTNTGYGGLIEASKTPADPDTHDDEQTPTEVDQSAGANTKVLVPPPAETEKKPALPHLPDHGKFLKLNDKVVGRMYINKKGTRLLKISVDGTEVSYPCPGLEAFTEDQMIQATVVKVSGMGGIGTLDEPVLKPLE